MTKAVISFNLKSFDKLIVAVGGIVGLVRHEHQSCTCQIHLPMSIHVMYYRKECSVMVVFDDKLLEWPNHNSVCCRQQIDPEAFLLLWEYCLLLLAAGSRFYSSVFLVFFSIGFNHTNLLELAGCVSSPWLWVIKCCMLVITPTGRQFLRFPRFISEWVFNSWSNLTKIKIRLHRFAREDIFLLFQWYPLYMFLVFFS